MRTVWERTWASGDHSVSIEASAPPEDVDDPHYTFLLVILNRLSRRIRLLHVGVLHYGRLPVGLGWLLGGKLGEWRWR